MIKTERPKVKTNLTMSSEKIEEIIDIEDSRENVFPLSMIDVEIKGTWLTRMEEKEIYAIHRVGTSREKKMKNKIYNKGF
ncbi:TPA: hypothetical protein QCX73_005667 [Bacillus mycoides]|nr:hypothetical protein [Bacillus mycoides]HDR7630942.1 hypothetical protein [Bacillus mycoides]